MDVIYWSIPAIVIAISIAYLIYFKINKKNNKELIKDNTESESVENPLPYEFPWEIKSYKSTDMQLYNPPQLLALTDTLKSNIDHVIKLTPKAKDVVQSERKVVVRFSEDVYNKIKSGELKIMKKKGTVEQFRTMAVDQKNTIRKHGWLEIKDIKKVNPAQLANVALGVMTVITAQEHLDKINKQLTTIDRKVDNLLRNYQNDRIGKIQGSIQYLKSIFSDITNPTGGNKQLYLTKIEDISLQCYQEMQSIIQEFPHMTNEVLNIKEKAILNVDNIVNDLKEVSSTFEQKLLIAFGNLEVMSICLKVRNDLEENSKVSINRLSDIENYFHQLLGFHDNFNTIIKDKQLGLDATFKTDKSISKRKLQIEEQLAFHNENITRNRFDVDQHIVQLKNNDHNLIDETYDLQIEYDDNDNVTAVYKLKRVN